MDSARSIDIDHLRRDIEATRVSISRTAGELRGKASEAMEWQTYVERYPGTILAAAALLGVAVGRRLARGLAGNGHPAAEGEWTTGPSAAASMARVPARLESDARSVPAVTASWQRLGTRVEGLVNRMIDDVADAVERALVPALVGGVQGLLEGRNARTSYRPAPPERGEGATRESGQAGSTHHR